MGRSQFHIRFVKSERGFLSSSDIFCMEDRIFGSSSSAIWGTFSGEYGVFERRGQCFEIWSFSPQLKQPSSLGCLGDGLRVFSLLRVKSARASGRASCR